MLLSLFSLVLQQNKNVVKNQASTVITHFSYSSESIFTHKMNVSGHSTGEEVLIIPNLRNKEENASCHSTADEALMISNLRNTEDSLSIFTDHTIHTLNYSNVAS
jgi:hypothetical protein